MNLKLLKNDLKNILNPKYNIFDTQQLGENMKMKVVALRLVN